MAKKTLERRLYDCWRAGDGIHLSADEVRTLLGDDAMQTRIGNAIASDHGFEEPGAAEPSMWGRNGSVPKFLRQLKIRIHDARGEWVCVPKTEG